MEGFLRFGALPIARGVLQKCSFAGFLYRLLRGVLSSLSVVAVVI